MNRIFQHREKEKKTSPASTYQSPEYWHATTHGWRPRTGLTARPVSVHNKWKAVELVESCASEFHWPQLRASASWRRIQKLQYLDI